MKRISGEGLSCVGVRSSGFRGPHSIVARDSLSDDERRLENPCLLAGTSAWVVEEEI